MQHKTLSNGAWVQLPISQQFANIGSETYRVVKWLSKGRNDKAEEAFERAQELIDLTIKYGRIDASPAMRSSFLREICRFREVFCAAFLAGDIADLNALNRYLDHFASIHTILS